MSVVQRPAVDSAGEVPIAALADTVARAAASELYAARLCGVAIRTPDDFLAIPLTTRADLQQAGVHGTRAVPLTDVCHYGESSGTPSAPRTRRPSRPGGSSSTASRSWRRPRT
ncbi:MAG: phenylacetate--CoA ligase [Deltaproteobacteria bacterium]|nr:MAG: phenylacetate--CoA ligase [Deltaproteobacteria bacterium]